MFEFVDNYCERLEPGFWAEPLNAITNLSFILAAIVVAVILGKQKDVASKLLLGILILIGVGSFLFHTFAQQWASIADVVPILLFILTYIYFATNCFLGQSPLISAIAIIGFFPFAIGASWLVNAIFGRLNGSVAYVSVALLIGIYAALLFRGHRKTSLGLLAGAAILLISIAFRSIDQAICQTIPVGSHFLWHLLNGLMLGWMIVVLSRHKN